MNTRLQLAFTKRETSFFSDPEALGCLLHEILELCTGTDEPISLESVHASAVGLGYRGHATPIRRMLVAKGFLTDAKKGKSFYLHEGNRVAIDHFFHTNEKKFSNTQLSDVEKGHLFHTLGGKGSAVEALLVRVMRFLSILLEELETVSSVERTMISDFSKGETDRFLALEHFNWSKEKFQNLCEEMDTAFEISGEESEEFLEIVKRYTRMYIHLSEIVDTTIVANDRVKQLAYDTQVIHLLKSLHTFLRWFSSSFLKMEDALS